MQSMCYPILRLRRVRSHSLGDVLHLPVRAVPGARRTTKGDVRVAPKLLAYHGAQHRGTGIS